MFAKRITTVMGVLALIAPGIGGCATGMTMGARQTATDRGVVVIDGKIIRSEARTLLELLQDDPLVRSILAGGPAGEHRGLVMLDGIALVDLQRLADIPLYDVRSVERLRGPQATSRYGSRANAGAIVISTHQRDGGFPEETFIPSKQRCSSCRTPTGHPGMTWGRHGSLRSANSLSSGAREPGILLGPETALEIHLPRDQR